MDKKELGMIANELINFIRFEDSTLTSVLESTELNNNNILSEVLPKRSNGTMS
jgi:hypothetical protein